MMLLYENEIPVPVHVAPLALALALLPPLPQLPPAHLSPVSPEAAQPLPSAAEEPGHKLTSQASAQARFLGLPYRQ